MRNVGVALVLDGADAPAEQAPQLGVGKENRP